MLSIALPWPPSANKYWRRVGTRTLLSADGRAYKRTVAGLVLAAAARGTYENERLSVAIECYPPDRRRRDLDNLLKPVLDALEEAGVFVDDSQIDDLRVRRMSARDPSGRLVVRISVCGQA